MTFREPWTYEEIMQAPEEEPRSHFHSLISSQLYHEATCGGRIMVPYEIEAELDDEEHHLRGQLEELDANGMIEFMIEFADSYSKANYPDRTVLNEMETWRLILGY